MKKFTPVASRPQSRAQGASSGIVCPGKIARCIGFHPHGPWLFAYMFRRFGPPNIPSDDHKELASWCLTTPVPGCFLTVTPYMGDDPDKDYPTPLSFGYLLIDKLYTAAQTAPLPVQQAWRSYTDRALRWAFQRGVSIVTEDQLDGRKPLNKYPHGSQDGPKYFTVWTNKADRKRPVELRMRHLRHPHSAFTIVPDITTAWRKAHPKTKRPPFRYENPAVIQRIKVALATTLLHLQKPVFIRDIGIDPNGRVHDSPMTSAAPYEHAGYACKPILPEKEPAEDPLHATLIAKHLKPGDTITHTRCMGTVEEHIFTGRDGIWLFGKPTRDTKRLFSCAGPVRDIAVANVTHINRVPILEIPDFEEFQKRIRRKNARRSKALKKSSKPTAGDDIPF